MAWVMSALGVLAVMMCAATSMLMNWHFGFGQGGSEFERYTLGGASVAFDILKMVLVWRMWEFLRERRLSEAAIAGVFGLVLTAYAINSAIGFVAQTKGAVVGGREAVRATLIDSETEIAAARARHATIKTTRATAEIEREIAAELAMPVMEGPRLRGTIEAISSRCTVADKRTIEACARINQLRVELASAAEATRLERQIGELRGKIETLRMKGGNVDTNPQAGLIAGLTRGWLSVAEVMLAQTMVLPILLELCAAFGLPLVVDGKRVRTMAAAAMASRQQVVPANAEQTSAHRGKQRLAEAAAATPADPPPAIPQPSVLVVEATPTTGDPEVFFEVALRRDRNAMVERGALYPAYKNWCAQIGATALVGREFVDRFAAKCDAAEVRWVERDGKSYIAGRKLAA